MSSRLKQTVKSNKSAETEFDGRDREVSIRETGLLELQEEEKLIFKTSQATQLQSESISVRDTITKSKVLASFLIKF